MINETQMIKLFKNWGENAESMACLAEVRFFDPLSKWECYIYALNPENVDDIACIIKWHQVEVCNWKLSQLLRLYNEHGECPIVDTEYRPRRASELFKKLNEGNYDRE